MKKMQSLLRLMAHLVLVSIFVIFTISCSLHHPRVEFESFNPLDEDSVGVKIKIPFDCLICQMTYPIEKNKTLNPNNCRSIYDDPILSKTWIGDLDRDLIKDYIRQFNSESAKTDAM